MTEETNKKQTPLEVDEDILRFVRRHFDTARKNVESLHDEIRYNREMYLNSRIRAYWDDPDLLTEDERHRVFRSAIVATKIDNAVSIQTDSRPSIFINPEPPSAGEPGARLRKLDRTLEPVGGLEGLADTLTRVFDNWWEENRVDEQNYLLVKEARVCGASVAKVWWNPDARNGEGDAVYERIPIEDFYPDPDARDIADSCFCFHAKIMPLEDVAAAYGIPETELHPDPDYSILFEGRGRDDEDNGRKYRLRRVVLVESYFRDDATLILTGPDGEKSASPRYRGGRLITFVGNTLLRDEPNPYRK